MAYAGATGAVLYLRPFRALAADDVTQAPPNGAVFSRSLRRRDDFLALRLEFHNLQLDNSKPPRLVRVKSRKACYIVADLGPQHIADRAFSANEALPPPGDVRAVMARGSRLAFRVPVERLPLPFNLETILDWTALPLSVVPAAVPPLSFSSPAPIRAPESTETAIEIPWFLVLSPQSDGGWFHETAPVTHNGRTELWHTRLGVRVPALGEPRSPRRVQAVWARDPGLGAHLTKGTTPPDEDTPFTMSLSPNDRYQIVRLTSDQTLKEQRRALEVKRLMLSALGGWFDSQGVWDSDVPALNLIEWTHRAGMGRDTYVRTIKKGYLFPFGHKATRIEITERKFRDVGSIQGAYLTKREFIVVREPVKEYGPDKAPGQPNQGRATPFRSVRILTAQTPDLDPPTPFVSIDPEEPKVGLGAVLPKVDKQNFEFQLEGSDWAGQTTKFTAPLVFVSEEVAFSEVRASKVRDAYNEGYGVDHALRRRPTEGQPVAFAPPKEPGDTTFEAKTLTFGSEGPQLGANALQQGLGVDDLIDLAQPLFYPILSQAEIRLPAVAQLAKQKAESLAVELFGSYVEEGLAEVGEAGQVFLNTLKDQALSFAEQADVVGALATPNFDITGITRNLGPVGGLLDTIKDGKFTPQEIFDTAAKILGGLKLADILDKVLDLGEGPKIQTLTPPGQVITKLTWKPDELVSDEPLKLFKPRAGASLELDAQFVTELVDVTKSTFDVKGDLRSFTLQLIGEASKFMEIDFEQVTFTSGKDKKPDVKVELGDVRFAGPLAFVEEFRKFLTSLGKGAGIDVTPKGIEANISIALPQAGIGILTIKNMSINAGTIIPFNGDAARARFSFCTRENPFVLSISMFGGGGFFGIECGLDQGVMLEVALEFGANASVNLGVASGGVSIMAGIYIAVENEQAILSGYLEMAGYLSVLGIISISCELYLGFTYYSPPIDKCIGRARFYLEIEFLVFSFKVEAEVERRFGGENDPTFAQLVDPPAWNEYCAAFAPIGAP